jgi:hypothetical protein
MELVIGGAIAFIGSAIVQAFVIPRVNRRARAIDRWEQDVLLPAEATQVKRRRCSARTAQSSSGCTSVRRCDTIRVHPR